MICIENEDGSKVLSSVTHKCPSGICYDGRCISTSKICYDSDSGERPSIVGTVHMFNNLSNSDYCADNETLIEYYCTNNGIKSSRHFCEYGCKNGSCIGLIEEPPEDEDSAPQEQICQGCVLDEKCYTLGYRVSGEYCSENKSFIPQLDSDSTCDNNFECESNVCVSGRCISQNFIQKIISWFEKLFSRKK